MSILIGNYEFDGPYDTVDELQEKQGVFAVLHCSGGEYELIHVSEAINIKERIEVSQSAYSLADGSVLLAACYTPRCGTRERRAMVSEIQREFDEDSSSASERQETSPLEESETPSLMMST